MSEVLRALFVTWKNPVTGRFRPVARLAQIQGGDCAECFEFAYIRAVEAAQSEGFMPFLSFPDFATLYRSRELFPMFANRLMPKSRPDFDEYMEQLGLPPATISPITILSRSAGRRVTDTLELFPLPELEPEVGYRTWFWAHGLQHLNALGLTRLQTLDLGERLFPECDPTNPGDTRAIVIRSEDQQAVGYVPSYLLDDAHHLRENCSVWEVYVEHLNSARAPLQQRLLCRLESCWPIDFVPYSTPQFVPLPANAASIVPPSFQFG